MSIATVRNRSTAIALVALTAACSGDSPFGTTGVPQINFDAIAGARLLLVADAGAFFIDGGTREMRLLPWTDVRLQPALSPDGDAVAYKAMGGPLFDDPAIYDIFVSNLDGSAARRLSMFDGNREGPPAWSADGSTVLFPAGFDYSRSPAGIPAVYSVSPDGSTAPAVLVTFALGEGGTIVCPTSLGGGDNGISVRPNGDILTNCTRALHVVTPGQAPRPLSFTPTGSALVAIASAEWSPDGTRVAFVESSLASSFQIVSTQLRVVNGESGVNVATVSLALPPSGEPPGVGELCWLPGGHTVVFLWPDGAGDWHLYAVSSSGGVPIRVSSTSGGRLNARHISCAR